MQKATNILISVSFTIGCFTLWLIIALFQCIYPLERIYRLPKFTLFCIENKMFFLIFPIPLLLFSVILALKRKPSTEMNLFYLGILAITFVSLFFSVVAAVGLPWIPVND